MAKKPQKAKPKPAPGKGPRAIAKDGTTRGRPSKFTPETRKRILDAVRSGNYLETCAAFGRVSYETLNEWIKRGEKVADGLPVDEQPLATALEALDPLDREYLDFSESIKEERAKAEMQALLEIQQAARGTQGKPGIWQAHAWFLERSFPHRWGRRVVQKEISGPGGGPVRTVDETPIISDADRLARLQKLLGATA